MGRSDDGSSPSIVVFWVESGRVQVPRVNAEKVALR